MSDRAALSTLSGMLLSVHEAMGQDGPDIFSICLVRGKKGLK